MKTLLQDSIDVEQFVRNDLDKVLAIETVEVEIDANTLLEYLKNEYAQKEILNSLDNYLDTVSYTHLRAHET